MNSIMVNIDNLDILCEKMEYRLMGWKIMWNDINDHVEGLDMFIQIGRFNEMLQYNFNLKMNHSRQNLINLIDKFRNDFPQLNASFVLGF